MADTPWRNCITDLPDWCESGPAEFMRDDGSVVRGQIVIDDWDEVPVSTITMEDGRYLGSIFDFKSWRLI